MSDQVIIITGGARGIGYGIAECFAERGAHLVIADTDLEAAQNAASQLNENSIGVLCDITQREQVRAMVAQTLETFGRINVLVNNAGICPFVDVMEISDETWRRTLDVDLNGAFICTQEVARHMIERNQNGDGGGRIIFITSQAENFVGANQVDYGAAKAGLRMTMRGFAVALGPHNITCNAVAPGHVLTEMTKHHWSQPGPAEYIKSRVPVGRMGTPRDIGEAVAFLASPAASCISGVSLHVDGGFQTLCP